MDTNITKKALQILDASDKSAEYTRALGPTFISGLDIDLCTVRFYINGTFSVLIERDKRFLEIGKNVKGEVYVSYLGKNLPSEGSESPIEILNRLPRAARVRNVLGENFVVPEDSPVHLTKEGYWEVHVKDRSHVISLHVSMSPREASVVMEYLGESGLFGHAGKVEGRLVIG